MTLTFLAFFSLRLCLALLTGSSSISAAAASYKIDKCISYVQLQALHTFKYTFIEFSVFSGQKNGFSVLRRTKVDVLIITEEMRVSFIYVSAEVRG